MEPTDPQARTRLIRRMTRVMDFPMALLSFVFLALVVADLAAPPDAPYLPWVEQASLAIWMLFVLEYAIKLGLAPDRRDFLRHSWFDLLVLAVPAFRLFRVLSAVRALRGARVLKMFSFFRLGVAARRGARGFAQYLKESRFGYVTFLTTIVVLVSAAAMLLLEREAEGTQITTYGDALWWSASTVTTVAGNLNPVTWPGRVLAVLLMVYGMVVFGYLVSQAVAYIQRAERKRAKIPDDE